MIVKGVLTAEDARLACEHGAAGLVVSNHGGRQLDGVAATIDALPEVVEAVDGRIEVLLDGGVRRGADVVKALALGARAVLAAARRSGGSRSTVKRARAAVLELLREEILVALQLVGCSIAGRCDARPRATAGRPTTLSRMKGLVALTAVVAAALALGSPHGRADAPAGCGLPSNGPALDRLRGPQRADRPEAGPRARGLVGHGRAGAAARSRRGDDLLRPAPERPRRHAERTRPIRRRSRRRRRRSSTSPCR